MADNEKLTDKQRKWIDFYKQGLSAAEACKRAGYHGNHLDVMGSQNLVKLKSYLVDREKVLESPRIADMQEINEFWSRVIRGDEGEETTVYDAGTGENKVVKVKAALRDRLKAAELRAKVQGAFIENINHTGDIQITVKVDEDEE